MKNSKCIKVFKLIIAGILTGVLGGLIGTAFHISVDYVTELREHIAWLIFLLPVGGIVIAAMYKMFASKGNIDTKRVFQSVKEDKDVPLVMLPLIFIGTVITHMLGGSAGREGAALQLGGSMGYNVAKKLKQKDTDIKLFVLAGMSSVFSALFGTPLTATVFSVEVTKKGKFNYQGLVPCLIASVIATTIARLFGVAPVKFDMPAVYGMQFVPILKVAVLAALCAGVCIVFALSLHKTEHLMGKCIRNCYLRAASGGLIIVGLTVLLKTTDYNGAGMGVITKAMSGDARYEAFVMKIIFTAITVASGFKGGEIVPTFFIGATFGCMAGNLLGINPALGASVGFVALFAGMTKCPVASFLLAMEVFGVQGAVFFAIAVVIAYILSGRFGLYDNAKIKKVKSA